FRMDSRNAYEFSDFAGFPGNIYQPVDMPSPPPVLIGGSFDHPLVTDETRTSSVALADVLSFMDERLQVTLAARYRKIRSYGDDSTPGSRAADYSDSEFTPVAGLRYRLTPELSVDVNHLEGLDKGDVARGENVVNTGEILAPYKPRQNEVGMKY